MVGRDEVHRDENSEKDANRQISAREKWLLIVPSCDIVPKMKHLYNYYKPFRTFSKSSLRNTLNKSLFCI